MFPNSELKEFKVRTNRNKAINSAKKKIDFLHNEIANLNNEANIMINKNRSTSKNKKQKSLKNYTNNKKKGISNINIINNNKLNLHRNYNQINDINNINYNDFNITQYTNYQNDYKKIKSHPKNNINEIIGIDDYIKNDGEEANIFSTINAVNEIENKKYHIWFNKIFKLFFFLYRIFIN